VIITGVAALSLGIVGGLVGGSGDDTPRTAQPTAKPTAVTSDTSFPNADTSGVPTGTRLTAVNGDMTITRAGTVVEGKSINGCITVNAADVIIRKSKVLCSGRAIYNNSTSLLVEDSEISCNGTLGGTGLTPRNFTARRINIYACENVIWAQSDVVIEDSYIHGPIDYNPATDPHTDAVQIPSDAKGIKIIHNTIYGNYVNQASFGNSAITIGERTSDVLIDRNLLAGGGYTVYCNESGPGTNFRITNNHFSRKFVDTVGGFGPWVECDDETRSGNVYHETGQPV
jgi:hypothetical protein